MRLLYLSISIVLICKQGYASADLASMKRSQYDCMIDCTKVSIATDDPLPTFLNIHCTCAFMTSCLSTLLNQSTVQEIRQFACCLPRKTCKGKKLNTESTTYVAMSREVSSHKSSCLANCRLLHVSIHCCLVFVQSVQEASVCVCSQCLDRRSQKTPMSSCFLSTARYAAACLEVKSFPLTSRFGRMDNYNFI